MRISWASTSGGNKSHLHLRVICLANHASVTGFIVDFYCHKAALVVEVDGDIHDLQQEEDARQEKVLSEMGLRTCAEPVEALSVLGMKKWKEIWRAW